MTEINLLKNDLQSRSPLSFIPRSAGSLYIVLAILALQLLLYGGMIFYQSRIEKDARDLERKAAEVDLNIEKLGAERKVAVSFQRRLNNLQALLDKHVFWTQAFLELEKHTLKTVSLSTMQVDETDATFVVTGTAPSVTEIGKYILGLRTSDKILDVDLTEISQSKSGQAGYDFDAEVKFDGKLLSPYGGSPGGRQ